MRKIIAALLLLGVFFLPLASAQMDVPVNFQVAIFYKIFEFDRSLAKINGPNVVIGIFYNPQDAESTQVKEDLEISFSQLADIKIGGKNVVIKEVTSLQELHGIHVVYVAPGSDAFIKGIVDKCFGNKILSICGVEKYIHEGIAITVKLENNRVKIIINKMAVQLSGADLSSKLMALAQVV